MPLLRPAQLTQDIVAHVSAAIAGGMPVDLAKVELAIVAAFDAAYQAQLTALDARVAALEQAAHAKGLM